MCPSNRYQDEPTGTLTGERVTVFISYTHDDEAHRRQVLDFATLLTSCGILVELDRWAESQRKDWAAWAMHGMTSADYVLVIASAGYRRMGDGYGPNDRNLGGQMEASLLRDLLQRNRATWLPRLLPVLLPGHGVEQIPDFLQPYCADHYPVGSLSRSGAENLLRVLTRQPLHVRPPLGHTPELPPEAATGIPRWTPLTGEHPVIWRADLFIGYQPPGATVEVHLLPVDPPARPGVRRLETIRGELAALAGGHGLFGPAEEPHTGSSGRCAWARTAQAGVAVHRDGQRSCWFPLPRGTFGSVLDERDLLARISARLSMLLEPDLPLPEAFAPAVGIDPVGMVRLAPLSELTARGETVPVDRPRHVHCAPEDSVPVADLRRLPGQVADELTARLAAALR